MKKCNFRELNDWEYTYMSRFQRESERSGDSDLQVNQGFPNDVFYANSNTMETTQSDKKRVVVIGGGFAGLNLVKQLYNSPYYQVILVDKNNYNYFTPLLYQVATSFLEPSSIAYPFRKLFRGKNITFRMAEVTRIDPEAQTLSLSDGGELIYDYLVLAAGTHTNFFGNEQIQRQAYSLKGMADALHLRNELVKIMEKAQIESDPEERRRLMSIVIAGGGPTGVELAGMLAEMKAYILSRDYPDLDPAMASIHIIDMAPYLLAPMSKKSHQGAFDELQKLGVKIKLNTGVSAFDGGTVFLSDGTNIEARTLVWAAGVTANLFEGIDRVSLGKGNRLETNAFGQVKGYENIFAAGDIALVHEDKQYPNGHPQLAQPAIQQGRRLGKNLVRIAIGKPMKPFSYFDRGDMAIIGRKVAMADLFKHKLHISGFLGLLSWLFIHVISLVNYNNKIKTLYNWLVAYLTNDQVLRMIFHSKNSDVPQEQDPAIDKR